MSELTVVEKVAVDETVVVEEVTVVEETKAPEKVTVPNRAKPSGQAIRRITVGAKKARKNLDKLATTSIIEADAIAGLKAAVGLVGVKLHNEGKLSPLGHMSNKQNGLLDVAILTMKGDDFAGWVKSVAHSNPTSRRSDLEDNVTFIKRLQSHLRFISGLKHSGVINFPKRLAKVGLEAKADLIMGMFAPVSLLFDEYVAAGKF